MRDLKTIPRERLNKKQRDFLDLLIQGDWTMAEAARQLNKTRGYMTRVLSGETNPSDTVMEILRLRVNALKYPKKEERVVMAQEAPGIIERTRAKLQSAIDSLKALMPLPVISWARGGEGSYYEDQGHDVPKIYFPCKDPNAYILQLEGDSMYPIYMEGDLLVVAPNLEAQNNDLVILKTTEGEVLFKRMKHPKKAELFEFHSINPHHAPLLLRPDQIHRVSVVHSVVRPLKESVRAMAVSDSGHL